MNKVKVLILSDLHFEFHADGGAAFVDKLADPSEVDVCVLAGDIAVGPGIEDALKLFAHRYRHVVYVHGNHEFYHGTQQGVHTFTTRACEKLKNVHWLDCSSVEIEGIRFLGAPLWFPDKKSSFEGRMNDFRVIQNLKSWVYKENAQAQEFFKEVTNDDIVITHHLPSHRSVVPKYAGSPLTDFFVCDVEPLIKERQPRLWIHGHTHHSLDYYLGKTRVVCNPFGYARREENLSFQFSKVIEV